MATGRRDLISDSRSSHSRCAHSRHRHGTFGIAPAAGRAAGARRRRSLGRRRERVDDGLRTSQHGCRCNTTSSVRATAGAGPAPIATRRGHRPAAPPCAIAPLQPSQHLRYDYGALRPRTPAYARRRRSKGQCAAAVAAIKRRCSY
ncbi:hypothetical protein EVAR_8850_1 [Eumeta japonica]|uniref:Uncharacterized protein n=1 Tax=Eumeta variegata TaxID=151549 RepID=A0A4C1TU07_EUMVA|nr:hypothetical protein EVAR_8850_1 [Eumeta japonica]